MHTNVFDQGLRNCEQQSTRSLTQPWISTIIVCTRCKTNINDFLLYLGCRLCTIRHMKVNNIMCIGCKG
jgi:hypothetical protein